MFFLEGVEQGRYEMRRCRADFLWPEEYKGLQLLALLLFPAVIVVLPRGGCC